jgi:hypothetical protein
VSGVGISKVTVGLAALPSLRDLMNRFSYTVPPTLALKG